MQTSAALRLILCVNTFWDAREGLAARAPAAFHFDSSPFHSSSHAARAVTRRFQAYRDMGSCSGTGTPANMVKSNVTCNNSQHKQTVMIMMHQNVRSIQHTYTPPPPPTHTHLRQLACPWTVHEHRGSKPGGSRRRYRIRARKLALALLCGNIRLAVAHHRHIVHVERQAAQLHVHCNAHNVALQAARFSVSVKSSP